MKLSPPTMYHHPDGAWCVVYWPGKSSATQIQHTYVGKSEEDARAFFQEKMILYEHQRED